MLELCMGPRTWIFKHYILHYTHANLVVIGHNGWVTTLKVGVEKTESGEEREFLISGSRDKTIIAWEVTPKDFTDDDQEWGKARRVYKAHSHFIQDISLSQDSRYCYLEKVKYLE